MTHRMLDAHVHVWDVDRMRLSWWRPDSGLPRAASLDDLRAAAAVAPIPVGGAIAVQAADTLGEALWLAESAAAEPFLRAVVLQYDARTDASAWAGMAQPAIDRTEAGTLSSRVAGIRLATPAGALDFSDVVGLERLATGLSATGRVLELLVRPEQIPSAALLAARHPRLRVVLCHLGLGGGAPDPAWRAGLAAFAALPNTAAKVSGLVRERRGGVDDDRVEATIHHAFDTFGPDRLMFGSDWPISSRFAPYAEVLDRTAVALPELDDSALDAFWAGTAAGCYAVASAG